MNTKQLKKKLVGMINLGCDKNRVDTEHILGILSQYGFTITNQIEKAQILLINTCSFIHDAREESISAILESVGYKKELCEKVIVLGCLTAPIMKDKIKHITGVDAFVPMKEYKNIINIIEELYGFNSRFKVANLPPNRIVSTPKHYAYLKIADGCNNKCAFCVIPKIKGAFVSEPIESLVEEAKALVKKGAKELILVAQDVTRYGIDLYKKPMLVELLQKLSKIDNLEWIRLHYCYPEMVTDELIKEIDLNPKICKYIDIPMQHVSDEVLKNMHRASSYQKITSLIERIRKSTSNIAIRSTFIVGFPGETRRQFKELLKFLKLYKLNYVGFFPYSKEDGTTASKMKKQIKERTKVRRLKKAQSLQTKVLNAHNLQAIGKECIVLCDNVIEPGKYYIGRTEQNSPEVDSLVYIKSNKPLVIGEFYTVKIKNIIGYDLEGEIL